jgi:ABC-type nitrate/sulfonate/bicarbonate transport system substrate-binding protein
MYGSPGFRVNWQQRMSGAAILTAVSFTFCWVTFSWITFSRVAVAAPQNEKVSVGTSSVLTDGVLYIARQKGFFDEQRLDVDIIPFDSSPKLIPPLGIGQIDVAAGAATASLYNAVARKINLRIVADKGSTPPQYDYTPLVIRKSLIDSGKVKGYGDLVGLTVAEAGAGSSTASTLNEAMKKAGFAYKDVRHTFIPYTSQFAAFSNGAIDAAISAEPTVTQITEGGLGVRMPREEFLPEPADRAVDLRRRIHRQAPGCRTPLHDLLCEGGARLQRRLEGRPLRRTGRERSDRHPVRQHRRARSLAVRQDGAGGN